VRACPAVEAVHAALGTGSLALTTLLLCLVLLL
jgi:hypothetical protein